MEKEGHSLSNKVNRKEKSNAWGLGKYRKKKKDLNIINQDYFRS